MSRSGGSLFFDDFWVYVLFNHCELWDQSTFDHVITVKKFKASRYMDKNIVKVFIRDPLVDPEGVKITLGI